MIKLVDPDPQETLERNCSNLLAFRLLCEAWKRVHIEKQAKLGGLSIHPPATLNDWLAPFGKSGENDIPEVAAMIGSQKAEALDVLNAVKGNGDVSGVINAFLLSIEIC